VIITDLDQARPIGVLADRKKATLRAYFASWPQELRQQVEEVSIDLWRDYRDVAEECFPNAVVVADRFHVMKQLQQELDELRKKEQRQHPKELKHSKYALLKNEAELNEKQQAKLAQVAEVSPRLKLAHSLKEQFRALLEEDLSVVEGGSKLAEWCAEAQRVGLFTRSLETFSRWLEPILNYFRQRTSNGVVEGINNKIKVIKRMAYGFRNFESFRLRVLAAWWG
jgi:transposase